MKKLLFAFILIAPTAIFSSRALACDLCAIYTANEAEKPTAGTLSLGLAEQFTSSGRIQQGGREIDNPLNQHLESSVTQLFGRYDISGDFGVQMNLPYISRRYRTAEDDSSRHGIESGIGDLSILVRYSPIHWAEGDATFNLHLYGGIKLPTGDSDGLAEEHHDEDATDSSEPESMTEHEDHEEIMNHDEHTHLNSVNLRHGDEEHSTVASAVHGHDLALGSGSVDFPLGLQARLGSGRVFAVSMLQYIIRQEGDHNYEFADDLQWQAGTGYYIYLEHESSLALKVNLSGEYKRKDRVGGETEDDTAVRSLFLGPELVLTKGSWAGELAWDAPLDINNSGTQAVPEYRLRAALTYRF